MHIRKVSRREALGLLSVSGAALSIGCGGDTQISPSPVTATTAAAMTTTSSNSATGACAVAPSETLGPYPSLADFIRSDIREGKSGVTLTLTISVVNVNNNCAAVANATVDVWQCDAEGHYSQYAQQGYNGTGATFLRGIQLTNGSGQATFTTVYPGWYQGRATHIHVEILENGASRKVTQIAFPESVNASVYASGVYASKGQNPTSNASDNVFSDSLASELATVTGDPATGYLATFTVGIAV
jgi:protocatechuate 3,4-dioxygenase beta subunit